MTERERERERDIHFCLCCRSIPSCCLPSCLAQARDEAWKFHLDFSEVDAQDASAGGSASAQDASAGGSADGHTQAPANSQDASASGSADGHTEAPAKAQDASAVGSADGHEQARSTWSHQGWWHSRSSWWGSTANNWGSATYNADEWPDGSYRSAEGSGEDSDEQGEDNPWANYQVSRKCCSQNQLYDLHWGLHACTQQSRRDWEPHRDIPKLSRSPQTQLTWKLFLPF